MKDQIKNDVYAFERISEKERILCVFHFSEKPIQLPGLTDQKLSLLIDSEAGIYHGTSDVQEEEIPDLKAGKKRAQ